ncbi:DUF6180 family protein [Alcaligenes sp. SDU_A2]|uniref:DUF6180 family protein n=1 Tax=Alcaligenes sp. SDU_A2 TaxID=3136634 RepID=UPI00312037D5
MLRLREGIMLAVLSIAAIPIAAQDAQTIRQPIEQRSFSALSVAQCLDAVQRTASRQGYIQHTDQHDPGQWGLYIGGAPLIGGSLVVYCIGMEQSTAYIIQAHATHPSILATPEGLSQEITQALHTATLP